MHHNIVTDIDTTDHAFLQPSCLQLSFYQFHSPGMLHNIRTYSSTATMWSNLHYSLPDFIKPFILVIIHLIYDLVCLMDLENSLDSTLLIVVCWSTGILSCLLTLWLCFMYQNCLPVCIYCIKQPKLHLYLYYIWLYMSSVVLFLIVCL